MGLLASVPVALVTLCAWAGWVVVQPELSEFIAPGASDVREERLGLGLWRISFRDGRVGRDQRLWMRATMVQQGWRRINLLNDCQGRCQADPATSTYVRSFLFRMGREIVIVTRVGGGPSMVRVDVRRCVRLPWVGCWPQ